MILKPRLFRKPRKGHWATKGLVGFWLFNEGSGNKVFDLSGNGNTGTFAAGAASPSWAPGKFGPCLSFDGGDYVDLPDAFFDLPQRSVSIWFYTDTLNTGMVFNSGKGDFNRWYMWPQNDGTIDITIAASDGTLSIGYSVKEWVHFVATYDGSRKKAYINGVLAYDQAESRLSGANNVTIGSYNEGFSQHWTGLIDNLAIYNRPLSAFEIPKLYRESFCMFERDPIELWSAATLGAAPPAGMAGAMTTNTGYWGW